MKYALNLTINGEPYDLLVEAHRSLLDVIREDLGLTGTKCACEDGRCGACTIVARDSARANGQLVKSCLCLALQYNGGEITTIEGVGAVEHLHPIQEAFLEHGGLQCGFCTPAMILSVKTLLEENPRPSEDEIRHALQGVLCRCGTYTHVTRAVLALARA